MWAKINRNFSNIHEFYIFVYILFIALVVSLLLKAIRIQAILNTLTPRGKSLWKAKTTPKRLSEYVDSILALQIFGFKPYCLNRSLILYHILQKVGVAVKINFGVRKADNDIEGHGWLTLNGEPYLENSDMIESFCLIYSYPAYPQSIGPQIRSEGIA
jgi:hypothetical protein